MSDKPFKVNLCTFMGRQANVSILIKYIERALQIFAIDHYWMIDMTRNHRDHEYIFSEQQRLNDLFPGRVHIVNRETRKKQLDDGTYKQTLGSWSPFYKFCETFSDDDVIIKCDDDTLYIDVETLRAAAELRWDNPDPFLMHANTINNGVTAYHQQRKNIWTFKDKNILKQYPTSGLTGPLFSHPDIACDCHEQFTSDLMSSPGNIEKYKLKQNIYFTNRVSINFIFMLGKDRDVISKIDTQDEYVSSSKIGQQLDRPNMIIGDFTIAHHTYGVQEPVMEQRNTFEAYKKLSDKIYKSDKNLAHKSITTQHGKALLLKDGDKYLARYWSGPNSVAIKNNRTGKYMNIDWIKTERVQVTKRDDGQLDREPLGVFWHKTEMCDSDAPLIYNMDLSKPSVMQIQDCTEVMKSEQPGCENERYMSFPVKMWFQQNYKKQLIISHKQHDGSYRFESKSNPGYYLVCDDRNPDKVMYFFKQDGEETWTVEDYSHTNNKVVTIALDRGDQQECENDPTTARVTNEHGLPDCRVFREFYWMVTGYIWEQVNVKDGMHIKLISDQLKDLYLGVKNDQLVLLPRAQKWCNENNTYRQLKTGKVLDVTNCTVK